MAFTRKYLASLGLENDKIDAIIEAHTEVTDVLKADITKYKTEADKIPGLEKQVEEAKQHKADADKFKADYEAEKAAHDKLKSDNAAQAETAKKTAALKKLLKDNSYHDKGLDKIVKYTDLNSLELDENGNFKDVEKIMANIEGEWGEYKGKTEKFEHVPANQPNNGGGSNQPSRASEIYARMHENMFGKGGN